MTGKQSRDGLVRDTIGTAAAKPLRQEGARYRQNFLS